MEPKTQAGTTRRDEQRAEESGQECSETPQGRKALERWARLQDESQGC